MSNVIDEDREYGCRLLVLTNYVYVNIKRETMTITMTMK